MSRLRSFLIPLLITAWSAPAGAGTWNVLPDGTGDAPTIRAAVDSAAAGDTLSLGCGTFLESDIHLKPNLVILGNGCATIDAQRADRHFVAYRLSGQVELNGLRLENGQATGHGGTEGGSLQAALSNVRVVDCVFSGCSASDGGAVLADSASVSFTGCEFTDCTTSILRRAIVRLRNSDGEFHDCRLHANVVSANYTTGGVILATGGTVTLTDTVCEDPAAPAVRGDSAVTATGCGFLGTGGVFGAPVQWTACTMEDDPRGVLSESALTLSGCTIVAPGAAIVSAGPATIDDCTLVAVDAALGGGGIVTSTVFRT
ncbi:hypothetical protein K8I85_12060, partial [bacterium]|nr:hypothetical protein [bacterium]